MSRRTCPHCHKLVRGPVKFCPHCGMHLPTGGPAPWPVWPFVAGALLVAALIGGVLLLRPRNQPAGAGSTTAPATILPTAAEPTLPVEPTAAPAPPTSTQAPPTSEPAPTEAPTQVVEASLVLAPTGQIDGTETNAALAAAEQTSIAETSAAAATTDQASTAFAVSMTEQAVIPTPSPAPPPPASPVPTPRPAPTAVPPPPLFMSVQKTGEGTDPRCINVRIFLPQGYPLTTSGWRLVADGLGASAPFNRGGYAGVCIPNDRQEFRFTILAAGGVRILSGSSGIPAKGGDIFEAYTQQ